MAPSLILDLNHQRNRSQCYKTPS